MGAKELGERLKDVRSLRQASLKDVAEPAGVSPAYLQKLERGEVTNPSPHHLHSLSRVLRIPYAELMQLAGYVVPRPARTPGANVLLQALNSEDVSAAEARMLAEYLRWHRERAKRNDETA